MEIKNRLHYFIKIESVWGVKVHILSRLKIKNFVLEKNFFSRYPIWKSLCLPVKNPNFPKIFFASSRAPQKLQKKSVWRNPSINFDLVYLILFIEIFENDQSLYTKLIAKWDVMLAKNIIGINVSVEMENASGER